MVICELCASANNETDESCRVCGQALRPQAEAQVPVPNSTESQRASDGWPGSTVLATPQTPTAAVEASALQMSAVKQAPQTGVPPMMSSRREEPEPAQSESSSTAMPGFMQSSRAAGPQPEPVQLISASDLPDWIKQIAAADEAKAAAEAEAAEPVDPTATIVRRPLPGETHAGGPSTGWLSKSGALAESSEHWGAAEVANAHWGGQESADPTSPVSPGQGPPSFVPSTADAYSYPKPKRRFSLPAAAVSSSSASPVYRRTSVQLAAIAALVTVLVLLLL